MLSWFLLYIKVNHIYIHMYIYTSSLFWMSFPFRSPQSTEQSSLRYTVGSYQLSVLCSCCSVTQSCPTLCNPMDCFIKLMSIESVMLSNHLILCCPFSSCLQSFLASVSFLMSQHFPSGGQSIGASAFAQTFQ